MCFFFMFFSCFIQFSCFIPFKAPSKLLVHIKKIVCYKFPQSYSYSASSLFDKKLHSYITLINCSGKLPVETEYCVHLEKHFYNANEHLFLFSIEDYPTGTWLGDENNPEMRVRCPVSQADMLHISTNCRTAEKMALTLLDYLFHREVQAVSNLSGQGKHGKKQLDPLMIYGIRCKSNKRPP